MNLYDMFNRKDTNLQVADTVELGKMMISGAMWRGFYLKSSSQVQLRILGFPRWYPFSERPEYVGWLTVGDVNTAGVGNLHISIENAHQKTVSRQIKTNLQAGHVKIPWPAENISVISDLCIRYEGPGKCFFAIHRALDRKSLLGRLIGKGVEIGPGHQPQVKPSKEVTVSYIEQMPATEWRDLYAGSKIQLDESLWDLYKIGEAGAIPEADGSLDFIFSSHVFEHLANPLGHLVHWQKKLRPGGIIVAVVPDCAGCKDYQFSPTGIEEILDEHIAGLTQPTLFHYQRYYLVRNPKIDPREMLGQRKSIHVHFFTRRNICQVLRHAVEVLGFADFSLEHSDNHKDFHFTLTKGSGDFIPGHTQDQIDRATRRFLI